MENNKSVKLSAVIITFNEEANIGRCIDSIKSIADEILVIDSNSTDKTVEICREKNVTVTSLDWQGYSGSKNHGNALAKHDLILSIDADEALSEELKQSILNIKLNPIYDAYSMNRLTNYCGKWIKHCGWYPDRKLRLWQRSKGMWKGEIHEFIQLEKEVKVSLLKGDLLHYSFPTISSHVKTANNFSDIAALEAVNKSKKINVFVHVLLNPAFTFFSKYFLKLGFLDGYYGFVVCTISAHASFLKYAKIIQLKNADSS